MSDQPQQPAPPAQETKIAGLTIPSWFIVVLGAVSTVSVTYGTSVFVPWCNEMEAAVKGVSNEMANFKLDVSTKLVELGSRVDNVRALRADLDAFEKHLHAHVEREDIHRPALSNLELRAKTLEDSVKRLTTRLDQLERGP